VRRTLEALGARGDEAIMLDGIWRAAVEYRQGSAAGKRLPLRTLLSWGRLRPLRRPAAEALRALTNNQTLARILDEGAEERWELCDLLELLSRDGFDAARLWREPSSGAPDLCSIVPPETARLYSISWMSMATPGRGPTELGLTVGRLSYQTNRTPVSPRAIRHGVASHFITMQRPGTVIVQIVRAPHFRLPLDDDLPLVMFAGGTGISPFLSFLQDRAQRTGPGNNLLFLSLRTCIDFPYRERLEQLLAATGTEARVVFTRDDVEASFVPSSGTGRFLFRPAPRRCIGAEIRRRETTQRLWELIWPPAGGSGAYVYVCGRGGFAQSVWEALRSALASCRESVSSDGEDVAGQILQQLVAEGRYSQDVFTSSAVDGDFAGQSFYLSEFAWHNDDENGYWLVIDGGIYDVSDFAHIHPGGWVILRGYAGTDATAAYRRVGHHGCPDIDALLATYRIGTVRAPAFLKASDAAPFPANNAIGGDVLYRRWTHCLFLIVEVENTLWNEHTLQTVAVTYDETGTIPRISPAKLYLLIQTHRRFCTELLPELISDHIQELVRVTAQWCGYMNLQPSVYRDAATAITAAACVAAERLVARLDIGVRDSTKLDAVVQEVSEQCSSLEHRDKRLIRKLKTAVIGMAHTFERFGSIVSPRDRLCFRERITDLMAITTQPPCHITVSREHPSHPVGTEQKGE